MPDPSLPDKNTGEPVVRRIRGSRRAVRPGAPGADPSPQVPAEAVRAVEDTDAGWGAAPADGNDARLKQDVPPHWG